MNTVKQSGRGGMKLMAGVLATALVGAGAVAGEATPSPKAEASDANCIFSRSINNWRGLDSTNLVIWAPNSKEAYHVTLSFPLQDLRTAEDMAVIDRNGDGRICSFGFDTIVINSGPYPEKATIRGMTKLDEAGLIALGEQYKMQLVPKAKVIKDRPVK